MAESNRKSVGIAALFLFLGMSVGAFVEFLNKPQQKPCAQVYDQENHLKNVDQEIFDTRAKVINDLVKRNQELEAEVKQVRANPAAQMLTQTGHVMNEQQCRAWMSTVPLGR
jgi:hypothetical protein